jgi:LysM repeat protein
MQIIEYSRQWLVFILLSVVFLAVGLIVWEALLPAVGSNGASSGVESGSSDTQQGPDIVLPTIPSSPGENVLEPTIAPPPTPTQRTHIVQSGETLSTIASLYGVTWQQIAEANNMADPNTLAVDQVLIIPSSSP